MLLEVTYFPKINGASNMFFFPRLRRLYFCWSNVKYVKCSIFYLFTIIFCLVVSCTKFKSKKGSQLKQVINRLGLFNIQTIKLTLDLFSIFLRRQVSDFLTQETKKKNVFFFQIRLSLWKNKIQGKIGNVTLLFNIFAE